MNLFHVIISLAFVLEKFLPIQSFLNINPYLYILDFSFDYFISIELICLCTEIRYLTRFFKVSFQILH